MKTLKQKLCDVLIKYFILNRETSSFNEQFFADLFQDYLDKHENKEELGKLPSDTKYELFLALAKRFDPDNELMEQAIQKVAAFTTIKTSITKSESRLSESDEE